MKMYEKLLDEIIFLREGKFAMELTNLSKDQMQMIKEKIINNKSENVNVVFDMNDLDTTSLKNILDLVPTELNKEYIEATTYTTFLVMKIFEQLFQKNDIKNRFINKEQIYALKEIFNLKTYEEFRDQIINSDLLLSYFYLDQYIRTEDVKFKTSINVFIENDKMDLRMQKELNNLFDHRACVSTRFFVDSDRLLTYFTPRGDFMESIHDYRSYNGLEETKILSKKLD